MSGATSRFLTVELAKNDPRQLQQTFNTAFILHIGIAIIVLFLAETVGLWLLFEKLNIPDERMSAAVWVYQFSIISSMVSITQVPYNATLISHEKWTCMLLWKLLITVEVADRYTSTYYSM